MIRALTLLILSLLFFGLRAQKHAYLTVVDEITGFPVSGAVLIPQDHSYVALTDDDGKVHISGPGNDTIGFIIQSIGYETRTLNLPSAEPIIKLKPVLRSLKEVVVTSPSNRIFKTLSEMDIHVRPIVNSQEVLRLIPGLFIGQHAGGGKAEQIFLRGFDIDHGTDIAITVDGMPVNMVSHAHGQGYADLHFLIPEMIDKVNFDKGPYFADKGNFNTAGYVDFKTKDYLDKSFVKLEAGQFKTGRLVTGISLLNPVKHHGQSLILAGEASYSDGYFVHGQDFSRFNGMAKYLTPIGKNSNLNLSVSGFSSSWYASGQIPDRAVDSIGWYGAIDPEEGGNTSRYNLNAMLTTYLRDGSTLKNQLFYSRYNFELYSNFTFFLEDDEYGDEIKQKESRDIIGLNSVYQKQSRWSHMPVRTEIGLNVRKDLIGNIELSHTYKREMLLEGIMLGDIDETNAGVYVSQDYQLTPSFKATLGLRGDYFINRYDDHLGELSGQTEAAIVSPKLNLTYRFNDRLQAYLYNGRGFHSNDTRVVVPRDGKKILPAAYGNDLGIIAKPAPNLFIQAALWHLWLDQEFVYVGDGGVVEPSGKTRRIGTDLSLRYEPVRYWFADINLNYAHPRALGEARGKDYIPLAPVFTSIGGITYRKEQGWNGSIRYRYMADRPANEDNSVVAQSYFVTDLAVNYTRKKWEAGIVIQNLFNTKWKETQFDTESRLKNEATPVSEIHFTPGSPFFLRGNVTLFF